MSKAIYEELVAAGAPELPEGYYILITKYEDVGGDYGAKVRIRKHRNYWLDKTLDKVVIVSIAYPKLGTYEERIVRSLQDIWSHHTDSQIKRDYYADVRKYIGRHP